MPSGIEATLQHLDLAAGTTATAPDSQSTSTPTYMQQQAHSTPTQQDPETPAALQNTACLAATFSWLDGEQSLLQCAAVCQLWHSVLDADNIWCRVYLRSLPKPSELERVGSFRRQFKRLRALLNPAEPQPTALKGQALCYNAATGRLVSYNARQRLLSVLLEDGTIRSEVVAEAEGAAGTAHRPLLASTGSALVVLAAADGALQVWDAGSCTCAGVLGGHSSFVSSLSGSGHLLASSCSREMKLWDVGARTCLFTVPIGLPLPSPVLEPHVAVCHQQQLLALANCAAPAPSSVVKIYSTHPAPAASKPGPAASNHTSSSRAAQRGAPAAAAAVAAAAAASVVGVSSCPGSIGALLLKELPVNAAADMKLDHGLLFVASCFHGRAVSNNSPFRSERPYTVVVNVWETKTWTLTRLISPRLWTDTPMFSMQGTPLISVSQGVVFCGTMRPGSNNAFPSCCIHALQLQPGVATSGVTASSSSSSSTHGDDDSAPPGSQQGSSSSSKVPESSNIGTGAVAQGRVAVATAGGMGPVGYSSNNTVMLAVSDEKRDAWSGAVPLVADTGGRLTVLLTTPTQLVMAVESGQIFASTLLPAHDTWLPGQQQQQGPAAAAAAASGEQGTSRQAAPAAAAASLPAAAAAAAAAPEGPGGGEGGHIGPAVHVLQPHETGSRFISLDF